MKVALRTINEPKNQEFAIFHSLDEALVSTATGFEGKDDVIQSFFYDEVSDEFWYIPCPCHEGVYSIFIFELDITEVE